MAKKGGAKPEPLLVGGQAVIEGVLMRSKELAVVAVRTGSGKIVHKEWKLSPPGGFFRYPLLRGVYVLYDTLVLGFRALAFSANASSGEDKPGAEVMGGREMFLSFALAILLAVALFVAAPLFLAKLVVDGNGVLFNLVDGVFRLLAFLAYLLFISMFRDVQRIFQYHGAEHMAIHAYEHGEKLLPSKIRKYPTMHPRCGTSFLLIVVIVSVMAFSVVNPAGFLPKFLSRIVLLPVIAGASYELLRLGARFGKNILMKAFVFPGLLLQRITTKEPDETQMLVAVAALKAVLRTQRGN